MANFSSLLDSFLNTLLIKFSIERHTTKNTKCSSVIPEKPHIEDGTPSPLWNKLENNILDLIIEKLDIISRIRFSDVCKSWNLAVEKTLTPHPVLRLLPRHPFSEHLTFSDFNTDALHKLHLPNSVKRKWSWCMTSSDGSWIVVITSHPKLLRNTIEIFLFDPISMLMLKLPKITNSEIRQHIKEKRTWIGLFLQKFEIISVNGSPKIIVWLFGGWSVSFCKFGGKNWFPLEKNYQHRYLDICFVNGTLYVLRAGPLPDGNSSHVAIKTRLMKFESLEITVKLVPDSIPKHQFKNCISNFVNFNNELLRVHKMCYGRELSEPNEDGIRYSKWYRPSEFLVTKFEHLGNDDDVMSCTKLSGGLGDEALLFSQWNCICVPAKRLKGVEENCVYFLNDFCGQKFIACHEFGVYRMGAD